MSRFRSDIGDLQSHGPTGDLRARMSARDTGDASPGPGAFHQNAERLLAGRSQVEFNGVTYYRDALGGVGVRSGPNLRALMEAPGEDSAPRVIPAVTPTATPAVPREVAMVDPVAALTAHLPASVRASAVPKVTPIQAEADAVEALAAQMIARAVGAAHE